MCVSSYRRKLGRAKTTRGERPCYSAPDDSEHGPVSLAGVAALDLEVRGGKHGRGGRCESNEATASPFSEASRAFEHTVQHIMILVHDSSERALVEGACIHPAFTSMRRMRWEPLDCLASLDSFYCVMRMEHNCLAYSLPSSHCVGIIASCQRHGLWNIGSKCTGVSGAFCGTVFRAGIVLFDFLGCHYVLELRPEAFNLAELVADLARR